MMRTKVLQSVVQKWSYLNDTHPACHATLLVHQNFVIENECTQFISLKENSVATQKTLFYIEKGLGRNSTTESSGNGPNKPSKGPELLRVLVFWCELSLLGVNRTPQSPIKCPRLSFFGTTSLLHGLAGHSPLHIGIEIKPACHFSSG